MQQSEGWCEDLSVTQHAQIIFIFDYFIFNHMHTLDDSYLGLFVEAFLNVGVDAVLILSG